MSKTAYYAAEGNWTNLPLHQVLYEWLVKNMSIPTDMSTILGYIALILVAWYAIVWATRFIISIIWPLFLIGSAIIIYRILQFYEPEEIADIFAKSFTLVLDTLGLIIVKILDSIANFIK